MVGAAGSPPRLARTDGCVDLGIGAHRALAAGGLLLEVPTSPQVAEFGELPQRELRDVRAQARVVSALLAMSQCRPRAANRNVVGVILMTCAATLVRFTSVGKGTPANAVLVRAGKLCIAAVRGRRAAPDPDGA